MFLGTSAVLRTNLVTVLAFLHPLSNPFLRLLELVVIRRIDEISWCLQ